MGRARRSVEELLGAPVGGAGLAEPPVRPASAPTPSGAGRTGGALAMTGAHDAANRFDRTTALWRPPLLSADAAILPEKSVIDARSADIVRNDAFVQGAVALHRDNIVGDQYMLNSKPEFKILGLDETWASEFQEEVETWWSLCAESPDCWLDAARTLTFTGMVRLAIGAFLTSGEVLATSEWLRYATGPVKTAINMIDPDRLSNPGDQANIDDIRAGVKLDRFGAALGYYIRNSHPSDFTLRRINDNFTWKFVPARKPWGRPQVIHIYEPMKPGQTRGISELVTALKEIKVAKRFRDIVLQNAVLNATFAAAIESNLPPEKVFEALGSNSDGNQAILDYATEWLGAIGEYTDSARQMQLDGVKIPHLFPGTKLTLLPAGTGEPLGNNFEASLNRYQAAAVGVSYEQYSKDYAETNYSSARAGENNTWKFMRARKRMVADRFATLVFRNWLEEMIGQGAFKTLPNGAELIYTGDRLNMKFDALAACEWIGASRGQIDEDKETKAAESRLKIGISTQEEECARLGKDWRKVNAQLQREAEDRAKRGLKNAQEQETAMAEAAAADDVDRAEEETEDAE